MTDIHDTAIINPKVKIGDNVIIEFSKPISKTKKWKLVEILEK